LLHIHIFETFQNLISSQNSDATETGYLKESHGW